MNAYELADKLDWHWDNDCRSPAISKSADMLRQQADRIAELEGEVSHLKHINKNWSISEGLALQRIAELEKQCSEPVAWLWIHNGTTMNALLRNPAYDERSKEHWAKKGWTSKPLYTTPQIKELSDEEIHKAEYQFMDWNRSLEQPLVKISSELYVFQQALEILKKASEK